jgi:hypothetical protein
MVKRLVIVLVYSWLITVVHAQISDEQAVALARSYARRVESGFVGEQARVLRDPERQELSVWFSQASVYVDLLSDGGFRSYRYAKGDPDPYRPEWFSSDEQVWRAAEALLARFETPPGLERHRLVRTDPIPVIRCFFNVRPYGYQSWAGNTATVEFRKGDGKPLKVSISKGWTYGAPNIRVTEAQARAKACEVYGGDPSSWRTKLYWEVGYSPRDPQYIQELARQKIARLVYGLWRETAGRPEVMVIVDTVTGQVVTHGRFGGKPFNGEQHAPRSNQQEALVKRIDAAGTKVATPSAADSAPTARTSASIWQSRYLLLVAAFALAAIAAAVAVARLKRR